MGQKAHPKSLRLGIIHKWDSSWIAFGKDYGKNVKEDDTIRTRLKKKLRNAMVSRIEIDRKAAKLIVRLITGRPGIIVGRGGQGLDQLRKEIVSMTNRKEVQLDVLEVSKLDLEAQLVAESIAFQLEKRVAFRRAMKQAMQRTMRSGAKGIKIMVSGRLAGAEIARTEWSKEGQIPLHTFRADIDYGYAQAFTVFGIIGVKTWVYKGEVLPGETAESNVKTRRDNNEEGGRQGYQGGEGGRGKGGRGGGGRGRGNQQRRSGKVVTKNIADVEGAEGGNKPEAQAPAAPEESKE